MNAKPHLIALAVLALGAQAQAQTAAPDAGTKLDRVEITGSMIKRTDKETPTPVSVITREDIDRSGATTVDELLRMDPSVGAGGLDDLSSGNGFAAGTASISMRGMGSAATLVLINGRRIAPAAVVDVNSGQSTIFNVNSIPMSAIKRIEILKSGASSLYGSDALAGVVNIILRDDYQGRLLEFNAKQRGDGLFKTHTVTGVFGFGDVATNGYNVIAGVELFKRDAVGIAEAPNLAQGELLTQLYNRMVPSSTSSWPGNLYTYNNGSSGSFRGMLSPDCPTTAPYSGTVSTPRCLWDSDRFDQYTGGQDRASAFLRASWAPNANSLLTAELMASRTRNQYDDSPTSRTESLTTWGDSQGNSIQFKGLALPANHPQNPTRLASTANPVLLPNTNGGTARFTTPTVLGLRYRFADLPYDRETQADNMRLVVSGSTTYGAWDLDGGLLVHRQKNSSQLNGRLSLSGLNQVLADGSYVFGGENSAAVRGILSPSITDRGSSGTSSLDLRGSREVGRLAGGVAMLGLGGEFRHEGFEVNADPITASGDIIGRGIGEARGSRNVAAAYAELQLPFVKGLETQAAVRAERYTDFGSAITAKLAGKYKVNSSLALRGTWANGFRAPSLSQVTKSAVFAFSSGYRDPKLCPVVSSGNTDCSLSLSTVSLSNPNLKAEKSDSYTVGMLFEPTKTTDVVLDYWYIERRGEVDRLSAQDVLNREDEFPGAVMRLEPTTPGELGRVYQVRRPYLNLAKSKTSGVDFEVSQRIPLAQYGQLRLSLKGTHNIERKEQVEEGREFIDAIGFYKAPRNKGSLGARWSLAAWSTSLTYNFQSGVQTFYNGYSCDSTLISAGREDLCRINGWNTVDASVSYKGFSGMRLSLSVRNLADKRPPLDPNQTTSGYSSSISNIYGRYFSVSGSYEF
jgi:iron complex outermembrane receptor protein